MSRPTRARGLKLQKKIAKIFIFPSRPTRARGLKHDDMGNVQTRGVSRPTRARGLKLSPSHYCILHLTVAPHAGAWIETRECSAGAGA